MRQRLVRAWAVLAVSLGLIAVVWNGLLSIGRGANQQPANTITSVPLSSLLYRFDPATRSFFTVPLPLGSAPSGVVVTGSNPTQIWVAESGRNLLGQVIFTSTDDYWYVEYPVTSTFPSQPFRIAVTGTDVWFTERGANRVGRLNSVTGQLDEFYGHGLAANAGLSDIKVAPDGAVWLAGQQSNQIIQLRVNSPSDYSFQAFTDTLLRGPSELAIENADSIWFLTSATHKIGNLWPSWPIFIWPQVTLSGTNGLVFYNGSSWITDRDHNRLAGVAIATLTYPDFYGPVNRPAGIAVSGANTFWIAQQSDPSAVARFVVTTTAAYSLDSFRLPIGDLLPTGIDVAADNRVWLAAYKPYEVHFPVLFKATP